MKGSRTDLRQRGIIMHGRKMGHHAGRVGAENQEVEDMTKTKTLVIVALCLGFVLQVVAFLGVMAYHGAVTGDLECILSPIPSTCGGNPDLILGFIVYPAFTAGFALVGMSILLLAWKRWNLA